MTDPSNAGRRFENRVAVITGGGRGLGREYALLLAKLGAKVVVNDNGSAMSGDGADTSVAQQLVDEITAAGGEATANTDSVATPEGGAGIIKTALDAYGKIDVLIHNAGNSRFNPLATITLEEFRSLIDVHLMGAFHVVQPAFAQMVKAGYGRVVLAGSIGGLYTMPQTVHYAMSKSSMIGLNNAIAVEGAEHGIKSNVVLPGALTRMAEGLDTSSYPDMRPELVAPLVAYLCHESCSVTAELYASVAGRIARAFITETQGVYQPEWTIDQVGDRIAEIRDRSHEWTFHPAENGFVEHLMKSFAMARGEL
ncbi:MAG: SDR family NAD(P)-dependent oxidoreductase [Sphingomonadales bacterium]|nr:SDR family NAD(P)-dependent oxidoreductase [Sphingomonadales bacterium]